MEANLQYIKNRMPVVLKGLKKTVYSAAKEVMRLKQTGSRDYADAILDQNDFGGNTAEIYFYRFAPKGSPKPTELSKFFALLSDPDNSKSYEVACYQKWAQGITAVQRIIKRYDGEVEVNDMPLDEYLAAVEESGQTPNHRVHVNLSIPGQDRLCELREIVSE